MAEARKLTPTQDLLCGAMAGMCARMVVAPLDVVKIRFQVQSETFGRYHYGTVSRAFRAIVRDEGLLALWKGNIPALLMVSPYAAVQLASFYQMKPVIKRRNVSEPYATLATGAVSATAATVVTYPLDLLRTRLAAHPDPRHQRLFDSFSSIVSKHGVRGLYVGLQPTLVEIVPYMTLHFLLYERLKQLTLQRTRQTELQTIQSLAVGAVAGTVSKLSTLPLDNAKKIMQVQSQFQPLHQHQLQQLQSPNNYEHSPRYRGIGHVLYSLWKQNGFAAWFRGTVPSVLKAAPNSAVTFMVYEWAKRYVSGATNSLSSDSSSQH